MTLLARVPSLFEPRWYSDEGILAAVGAGMLQGRRLYVQVWDNQGPVVYGWMAAVLAVTQGFHPAMQLVLALQVLAAAGALAYVAHRVGANPATAALLFGLVLSLPVLEGDIQNTEVIALPFLCGAVALAIQPGRGRALLAGGLVAAAALCRPSFGVDGVAIGWLLLVTGRSGDLARFLAGGMAVVAAVNAGLALGGSWGAYTDALHASSVYFAYANGGAGWQGRFVLRMLPLLGLLAGGAWLGWTRRTPAALLLGLWAPLALIGSVMSARGFNHYALEAVPPLALLVATRARVVWSVPAAAGAVLLLQGLEMYPAAALHALGRSAPTLGRGSVFDWQRLPDYYARVWDGARASGPGGLFEQADRTERLAAQIRALPPGPLEVWGELPWLYVESGRVPAERYVSHNSAWRLVPDHDNVSVGMVEAAGPAALVVDKPLPAGMIAYAAARCAEVPGAPALLSCR